MTIEERYEWACKDPDIGALIPVLRKYGEQCEHITEFGVRWGCSASAWLSAKPKKLVCYDIGRYPSVDEIAGLANGAGIEFQFRQENSAHAFIEETDLLFVDTVHNADQVKLELVGNHVGVEKFILFHDTETYGQVGEGGAKGIWEAILLIVDTGDWRILEVRPESNGLTVLQRISK